MKDQTAHSTTVYAAKNEFEAQVVAHRLLDQGLDAVIVNSNPAQPGAAPTEDNRVLVVVRAGQEDVARAILAEPPVSDDELERQALANTTEKLSGSPVMNPARRLKGVWIVAPLLAAIAMTTLVAYLILLKRCSS